MEFLETTVSLELLLFDLGLVEEDHNHMSSTPTSTHPVHLRVNGNTIVGLYDAGCQQKTSKMDRRDVIYHVDLPENPENLHAELWVKKGSARTCKKTSNKKSVNTSHVEAVM